MNATITESDSAADTWFRSAFEHGAIGSAVTTRDGRFLCVNDALARLTGRSSAQLLSEHISDLISPDSSSAAESALRELVSGRCNVLEVESLYSRPDGTNAWLKVAVTVAGSDGECAGSPCLVVHAQDLTDQRESERKLAALALRDPLTGLPNRLMFDRRISALLKQASEPDLAASMFIDLDGFKLVNDTYGHAVGDQLLIAAGRRLLAQTRPADTVARFGGDEFTVLCEQTNALQAGAIAERIIESMGKPFAIGELQLRVTASIGIAVGAASAVTLTSMLRKADAAMYTAKARGGGRYEFFGEQ
jgi:diguanylate cyclase (GGDEF)-like protein/PAS domain S-box-containing protein